METIYMDSETPLPRFLLELNIFSTAKILYALLLNRANLSQKMHKKQNKNLDKLFEVIDILENGSTIASHIMGLGCFSQKFLYFLIYRHIIYKNKTQGSL